MKTGTEFLRQLKNAEKEFTTFIKENRFYAYLSAALIFLCWGDAAFREDIGVDTEIMIIIPKEMLNSWYGLGRFALVWTKRLFQTDRFSQTTCIIAMMAAIWLCCAAVGFSVWLWSGKDRRFRYFYPAFSAVFATAPLFTEQVYFSFQAFEVILGIFLILFSLHMAGRRIYLGGSFLWLVPALACGVWGIGIYQSLAAVFLAFAAFSFLIFYQGSLCPEGQRKFPCFFLLLRLAVFFLCMMAAYFAVSFTAKQIVGYHTGYLNQMFAWPNESLWEGIHWILVEIRRVYQGEQIFYSRFTVPLLILWAALNTTRGFRSGKGEFPLFLLVGGCFAASPLLMTVLLGSPQPSRMQMVYPLSFALAAASLTTLAPGKNVHDRAGEADESGRREACEPNRWEACEPNRWEACEPNRWEADKSSKAAGLSGRVAAFGTWGYVPALILCAALSWNQLAVTGRLLDTIHRVAVQDFERGQEIYREIRQTSAGSDRGGEELAVVYIGTLKAGENATVLRGDVIGHSVFEWDSAGPIGVSGRVRGLMFAHGFTDMPSDPTPEQYQAAREYAADMPCWPLSGSVAAYGDMVVVKLSEPEQ